MERGYTSPGVEIFRSEEVSVPYASGMVVYGIVGPAAKGPYGYQEITSIRQLHNLYGYAYLGKDTNGNRVLSDAIIAAERVLNYAKKIVFTRVPLTDAQEAKFKRDTAGSLKFTIANKDTTVYTVKASAKLVDDVPECTVTIQNIDVDGSIVEKTLCVVGNEEDLKKALEYGGVLVDVTVPEDYIEGLLPEEGETEGNDDVYVPAFDATQVNLTNEIDAYSNRDAVNIQVFAAPMGSVIELGKTTLAEKKAAYKTVNDKILAMVKSRGDTMGLFDYPKDLSVNDAKTLFTGLDYIGIDEQNIAVVYPAVKVDSVYTHDVVELGSSGILLDRMAYTDSNYHPWIAPAGYGNSKGVIPGVVSVNAVLSKSDRDDLYESKINPVVKFVGKGVVVFGNRTLKSGTPYEDPSLFEKLNVVRLANYITRVAYDVSLNILFEPNDKTTWEQWTARMTTEMERVKINRGVEEYKIKMDEETVSEEDKLMGRAPAIIYILPIGAVEYIPIHLTLTDNRAIFGEEE